MKTIKLLTIAAAAGMALASCSDYLDAENRSAGGQGADEYFAQHPGELLLQAYSELPAIVNELDINELGTDLYINARSGDDGKFGTYNITADDGDVKSLYTNCYKVINDANGVASFSQGKEGQEARFLRDYCYYTLTQQFGAVPYYDKYIADASREYPRTPLDELYTTLLNDLTDLYNNSALDAQNHQGRASKQAVAALAAKVALAKAWDCGTTLTDAAQGTYTVNDAQAFNLAAEWADKAINGIGLTMTFADKWDFKKQRSNPEEIFSVQYDRDSNPGDVATAGNNLMYHYMGYYGNCIATGQKGTPSGGDLQQSYKSLMLFEPGDQRYAATFMETLYHAKKDGSGVLWQKSGYLAPYFCSQAELDQMPIAVHNFPWYTTEDEAKQWIADHKAQIKKNNDYVALPGQRFAILNDRKVTIFTVDNNGAITKTTTQPIDPATGYKGNTVEYFGKPEEGNVVRKLDDPYTDNVTKGNCYRDIVLFHVSDMYLVKAEALLLAGGDWKTPVNAVRTRAGLGSIDQYQAAYFNCVSGTQHVATDLDKILDERARELYAERTRWVDLRRTKQLVRYCLAFNRGVASINKMSNKQGEIKWLRPIPTDEINANTALTLADQNPGY